MGRLTVWIKGWVERVAIQRLASIGSCNPAWMMSKVGLSTNRPS